MPFREKVYDTYDVTDVFPFHGQGLRPKANLDPRSGALRNGYADEIVPEEDDEEGVKD